MCPGRIGWPGWLVPGHTNYRCGPAAQAAVHPGKFHDRHSRVAHRRSLVSGSADHAVNQSCWDRGGRNLLPLTEFFGPPCLSCTAQRIKNPGPAVPPRISRVHLPGSGATISTVRPYPRDGKFSVNPEVSPRSQHGYPGGDYRESGQTPRPGASPGPCTCTCTADGTRIAIRSSLVVPPQIPCGIVSRA